MAPLTDDADYDWSLLYANVVESSRVTANLLSEGALRPLEPIAKAWMSALKDGRSILFFGNGGSCAQAQHLAGELIGRFRLERRALSAFSLGDNATVLTAIGNDYDYTDVYARQLSGLGRAGDVAVGLTTSGNSVNVISALRTARSMGLVTVALTGHDGGGAAAIAEHCFRAPSDDTARIQECHLMIGHILCEFVERELAKLTLDV